MALDRSTAAAIARAHGLNLSDAQALSVLADTEEEATELAEQFAAPEPQEKISEVAERIAQRTMR